MMTTEVLRIRSANPIVILTEVARAIFTEPRRYNQSIWGTREMWTVGSAPPCGTVCCIAGWVAVAKRGKTLVEDIFLGNFVDFIPSRAMKVLSLNQRQAGKLFDGAATSRILQEDRRRRKTREFLPTSGSTEYAHAGIRHIDRFMRREMGYTGPKLLVMFKREEKAAAKAAVAATR